MWARALLTAKDRKAPRKSGGEKRDSCILQVYIQIPSYALSRFSNFEVLWSRCWVSAPFPNDPKGVMIHSFGSLVLLVDLVPARGIHMKPILGCKGSLFHFASRRCCDTRLSLGYRWRLSHWLSFSFFLCAWWYKTVFGVGHRRKLLFDIYLVVFCFL